MRALFVGLGLLSVGMLGVLVVGGADARPSAASVIPGEAPVGAIVAYAGSVEATARARLARAGWLLCDGDHVAKSDFPDLYEAIGDAYGATGDESTFALPDLRGMFLRGLDDPDGPGQPAPRAGRDPDGATRAIGSEQAHATALPATPFSTGTESQRHTHDVITDARGQGGPQGEDRLDRRGARGKADVLVRVNDRSHTHNVIEGGDEETRPENVALNWIIRAQ